MKVSVIIPAYNAAATLTETIQSLQAQTWPHWEAIILDDGSKDATAEVARTLAAAEPRIRFFQQPNQGVSTARNNAIAQAEGEWIICVDADDWLLPLCLERLTEAATRDNLDVVYSGWSRVSPNGVNVMQGNYVEPEHLFERLSRFCVFTTNSCLVRRSLVLELGGFDPDLPTCEDWDLWMRTVRAGARYGLVREVLSGYRLRESSASSNYRNMLANGMTVIGRNHRPDPRVPNPIPQYVDGAPSNQLQIAQVEFMCWTAGLALGNDSDALALLEQINIQGPVDVDPSMIAFTLYAAPLLPRTLEAKDWPELWQRIEQPLITFLAALEERTQIFGLANRSLVRLVEEISKNIQPSEPTTFGSIQIRPLEIAEPIDDIALPKGVERVHCQITLEGEPLGSLVFPASNGMVPAAMLADSIASTYSWQLLNRFLSRTIYPSLRITNTHKGRFIERGQTQIAGPLPAGSPPNSDQIHDMVGWTVMLQELFSQPDWNGEQFYQPQGDSSVSITPADDGSLIVELSKDLPAIATKAESVDVFVALGGSNLGVVRVPANGKDIKAGELRVALLNAIGLELGTTVVRQALVGLPFEGQDLRTRLQQAFARRKPVPGTTATTLVLPRRDPYTFGGSESRRVALPGSVASVYGATSADTAQVLYVPGLIEKPLAAPSAVSAISVSRVDEKEVYGREYFEGLFVNSEDPWKYTSPYEQLKYEQTLAQIPRGMHRALEIGCAEGHFTTMLAPIVHELVVADISEIALERTVERCTGHTLGTLHLNINQESIPGTYDLIVCSEVLYYTKDRKELRKVAQKIADALEPGGYLVMAHANLVVDEPNASGFDWSMPYGSKVIGETFSDVPTLRPIRVVETALYRIQVFQRSRPRLLFGRRKPEIIREAVADVLPPNVGNHVLWNGGKPLSMSTTAVTTTQLPILMYHRVAPEGSKEMERYRVTPDMFEAQLRYLRDSGFYSTTLEAWREAVANKQPLPGRAILLTFDDGFLDFHTYAWPLLERYGFTATVFLVADLVGDSNRWDHAYGEKLPLMNWEQIRELQARGALFGGHTTTHVPLTGVSIEQAAFEIARSRAVIEDKLGVPAPAFAYPYGDMDGALQQIAGGCGYSFGLSCIPGRSNAGHSMLALARIEVLGGKELKDFIASLGITATA